MAGLRAFKEAFLSAETLNSADFDSFDGRQLRYEILWSMYESTVYRDIHKWAVSYRQSYALYRYIRSIYNPSYRLGEFWKSHLWGGQLDVTAGVQGALPIITENENLRPAIANLWRWSNWNINKDVLTLRGSIMGDQIIQVADRPDKGKVYLELVHPGIVSNLVKDQMDNVQGYTIQYNRANPANGQTVVYKETAERGVGNLDVVYRTYLNDKPYGWDDMPEEWVMPYGFIPMVHIKHNDAGLDWGFSELHPSRSKIHEADDLASMIGDQIRKSQNTKWLFTGMKAPATSPSPVGATATVARPQPGREEDDALYVSNADADAKALIADLNIADSVAHVMEILKELERDYPELKFDNLRASGTVSGEALRVARQPAETKVQQRRASYDDALTRAHMMAMTIGGLRDYPGFESFNLDSYSSGELEHSIGERPVFFSDPLDEYAEDSAFWNAARAAVGAGISLTYFLQSKGWADDDIQKAVAEMAQSVEES